MENKTLLNKIEALLNQEGMKFKTIDGVEKKYYGTTTAYFDTLISVGPDKVNFGIFTTKNKIYSEDWLESEANEFPLDKKFNAFLEHMKLLTDMFSMLQTKLDDINKQLENL
jgi:hypothetical protein